MDDVTYRPRRCYFRFSTQQHLTKIIRRMIYDLNS